jgi:hypothetical protein
MNKSLYDEEIEFPKNLRDLMKINFRKVKNADSNTEGFKRNKELQEKKWISYKQLKRIKNWFDNFKGSQNETEFILNGGFEMKNWVNNELRRMREYIKTTKKHKSDAGLPNQFISPHTKGDPVNNVRPSTRHEKTINKYDTAVYEQIKRINQIIKN